MSQRWLTLLVRGIVALVLIVVAVAALTEDDGSRCLQVSFEVQSKIESSFNRNILLGSTEAVRSKDFEKVWFVAGQLPNGGVAVWSTDADPTKPDASGVFIVANDDARSISDLGVDNASPNVPTMSDDGAGEAVHCVD